jgi:hypothetical protein
VVRSLRDHNLFAGLAGTRRSIAALAYALVFAAVVVMIAQGDIPGPDQFRRSHQVLVDLRARLTKPDALEGGN